MSKTPMRMCIVCRKMFPKNDLIRIVKNDNGVSLDLTGKKSGRGTYICKNPKCVDKCVSKKILSHVLKTEIDDEFYTKLLNECNTK